MKECPFCAEEIRDEAIKCKHCGSLLDGSGAQSNAAQATAVQAPRKTSSFSLAGLLGALLAIIGLVLGFVGIATSAAVSVLGIVLLVIGAGLGAKYK